MILFNSSTRYLIDIWHLTYQFYSLRKMFIIINLLIHLTFLLSLYGLQIRYTSGQPVLHTECLGAQKSLHWLLTLSKLTVDPLYTVHSLLILSTLTVDPPYTVHWMLILSTLTVNPLYIDCWPSLHWLLILSTLTVDPLYTEHWLLILSTLTVDPLYTEHWLLILSTLRVDPLYIESWSSLHWLDPLYIHCWSPQDQQRWLPFHVKVKVECSSSPCQSLIPPKDQQRWLPFHAKVKVECWSSPHRLSIPPQDQQCWSPLWCWSLIRPGLTVDRPPLQISTLESLIYWYGFNELQVNILLQEFEVIQNLLVAVHVAANQGYYFQCSVLRHVPEHPITQRHGNTWNQSFC